MVTWQRSKHLEEESLNSTLILAAKRTRGEGLWRKYNLFGEKIKVIQGDGRRDHGERMRGGMREREIN